MTELRTSYATDVVDLESPDDLALADRMKVGREKAATMSAMAAIRTSSSSQLWIRRR